MYEYINKQMAAGNLEKSESVLLHLLELSRKEGAKEIEIYALTNLYQPNNEIGLGLGLLLYTMCIK